METSAPKNVYAARNENATTVSVGAMIFVTLGKCTEGNGVGTPDSA
jgi:hypothetical protein